jgi:hypothetical protein
VYCVIREKWRLGKVLISLGTGNTTTAEFGLVPNHNYAVLDIAKEEYFRLCNPWLQGGDFRGEHLDIESNTMTEADLSILKSLGTRVFWASWSLILQEFRMLYLSWDPLMFAYRMQVHFTQVKKNDDEDHRGVNYYSNPQFSVHGKDSGELWILLQRHQKDYLDNPSLMLSTFDTQGKEYTGDIDPSSSVSLIV